jgi:two-component system response regulator FixJ
MCEGCKTITIVDDDADLLDALRFSFEVEGFCVRAYLSGEALLEDSDRPACGCLVLDYRLLGIDGLELLRRLRLRGVTLPAVLITTPPASLVRRAAEAGVPVIEKPLLTEALSDQVRALLSKTCPTASSAAP